MRGKKRSAIPTGVQGSFLTLYGHGMMVRWREDGHGTVARTRWELGRHPQFKWSLLEVLGDNLGHQCHDGGQQVALHHHDDTSIKHHKS
jgi:hypothetical protein